MTRRTLASLLLSALAAITVACSGARSTDDRTPAPPPETTASPLPTDHRIDDAGVVPSPPNDNGNPDDVPQAMRGADPVEVAQATRDAGAGGGRDAGIGGGGDGGVTGRDAGIGGGDAGTGGGRDAGVGGGIGGGDAGTGTAPRRPGGTTSPTTPGTPGGPTPPLSPSPTGPSAPGTPPATPPTSPR